MRGLLVPLLLWSSVGYAMAPPVTSPLSSAAAPALAYPPTRRDDVVDTQFGVAVADPYRWLENDVRQDAEVAAWVAAENKVTDAALATLPLRATLKARMTELYDYERFGVPVKRGGRYFYTHNSGLQNQAVLFVRDKVDGPSRPLIDPNGWSKDGATALAEWTASHDGSKLLYAVQDGGTDWRTLRIIDVASGKLLPDEIKWVKYSNLDWSADGTRVFYSRFPTPADGHIFQAASQDHAIYTHRLGTPQSADRRLFAYPANRDYTNNAHASDDGRWLVITTAPAGDRYQVSLIDLASKTMKPRVIVSGFTSDYRFAGNVGTTLYFVTNHDAPKMKLVAIDVARATPVTRTIVPEGAATLDGATLVGGRLLLSYLADANSRIEVRSRLGQLLRTVALPGIGTATGFDGRPGDPETFFAFASFNRPTTIYRYDVASGAARPWAAPTLKFNPDDFVVEQRFYASKDGTKVPMFIVHRQDVTGPAPTLLYAYGGFNVSLTPSYSPTWMAWLEQGGVFALANIRGGGEYGAAWHDAGRLAHKQNVFDDFIAAGEFLKTQHIAAPHGLAIEGGSNGGLLIGAVINQRPDLFDAAHPAVGVMDMTRFDRFTAGKYWVDDYGFPSKEDDFRTALAYSPYHNIRGGRVYPPVIVTTADTDDRVVPGHSFKYIAALQSTPGVGDRPHLIRIETRAGHGSGKPTGKIIEETSDVYAFLGAFTGLDHDRFR